MLWAGGQNQPYKASKTVTAHQETWRYDIRRYRSTVEAKSRHQRYRLPPLEWQCLQAFKVLVFLPRSPESMARSRWPC